MIEDKSRESISEILEERLSYIEFLKSLYHETLNIIRSHAESGTTALETCLQELTDLIQRRLNIHIVSILSIDQVSKELVLSVASGDVAVIPHIKQFRLKVGEGLTGLCAKTGNIVIANDVTQHRNYIRGPSQYTMSELCVPIKVGKKIVAILNLEDRNKNRFKGDLVGTMEEVALSIGLLIENKELYDEIMEHSSKLEQRIEQKVSELRKSEDRYRRLIENIQLPIFIMDTNCHLIWANPACLSFLGVSESELIGIHFSKYVKKGNMYIIYSVLKQIMDGKAVGDQSIELINKNNIDKTVELSASPMLDGDKIVACEVMLKDITERVSIERLKKNYLKLLEEEVVKKTTEIKDVQRASILAIATLAESIDDYTYSHLQRIREYCKALAEELRKKSQFQEIIDDEYIELLQDLSPLHDIGKVAIRDYILHKNDKLTEEEFKRMKEHTLVGANALKAAGRMIKKESIFQMAEMIARFHHQRWDGSGYPEVNINGEHRPLKGEEIPLCARIVALADVYDALTSKRPYKGAYTHELAKELILKDSGKRFDPEVADAFLKREEDFMRIRKSFLDQLDEIVTDLQSVQLSIRDLEHMNI